MKRLTLVLALLCALGYQFVSAQQTVFYHYDGKAEDFHEELDYHKLYGIQINLDESLFSEFYDPFKEALASNSLNESRSVDLLLEQSIFAETPEDKNLYNALVSLKYFDQNDFEKAIYYSKNSDRSYLSTSTREELDFKIGYAHFISRDFDLAASYFEKDNDSYKHHTIYYGAMTEFFLGDNEGAINGFKKIDRTYPYDAYVPYYLTQIYFADRDFKNVVDYGNKCVNKPELENKNRVQKLLGLAHFELENYEKANKHLAIYADETPMLTKEEFYQIAYSQYKLGKNEESISNFKEISNLNDTLGNLANYYIAEIYLSQDDKKAAQTAFGKVSKIATLPDLQQDALFNYALLSYELGDERIAINTLTKFTPENKHFDKSQRMLIHVLRSSNDFEAAMSVIENLPAKSDELLSTYQELSYKLAIQNFNDETPLKSLTYLAIAEETPGLSKIAAESIFWQALIHHEDNNMLRSQSLLDKYFKYTERNPKTKKEDVYPKAQYLQAYKLWRNEAFTDAQTYFLKAIKNETQLGSKKTGDAQARIADVYLTQNNYKKASEFYGSALRSDNQLDYAAFQIGMVEGFKEGPVDKIVVLEDFSSKYPDSEYRDDALFEVANAYFAVDKRNDALITFDKLLSDYGEESPLARKTLLRKGLISYNAGDVDAAVSSYRKIFGLNPSAEEKKEALVALEEIYLNELNDPEAYFEIAENEGGVKFDDIQKDSLSYGIALDQYKNGNYEKAANSFNKYQSSFPRGFYLLPALYYEGESFALIKEYSKATLAYEILLKKGQTDYYDRALTKAALINYNHEKDYEKAFTFFDELIDKRGKNELEYIESALVCANLTNKNDQVIKYAKLLTMQAASTNDQKATANFYLAKAAEKENRIDEAIKAYNQVVRLSKNNKSAESSYLVAELFYKQGNLAVAENQALETTKRAVNYPFWVAKSLLLLTDIFVDTKDVYNAKAAVEAVIDNYTEDADLLAEARKKKLKVDALEAAENRVIDPSENNLIPLDTLKQK